ncbi:MAG: hypothetical protein LC104_09585 [Bacteroidales bacterium]|nr:hypothetical protein [Bacteroidales bacterium]
MSHQSLDIHTTESRRPSRITVPRPESLTDLPTVVLDWLNVLLAPDQVVELRALGVRRGSGRPHTEAGFYDPEHRPDLVRQALTLTGIAQGVYCTLNPLKPDILARKCNRTDWAGAGELAKDGDVLQRRWLLVDVDPVRDPHVSATTEEIGHAQTVMLSVREHLAQEGWPEPVLASSGNGFHLLYRIDLPTQDGGVVERILKNLAARFNTDRAHIDTRVANPARICKLPGTLARKGDATETRPHRRACLLEVPGP